MSHTKIQRAMLLAILVVSNQAIASAQQHAPMVTAAAQLLPRANDPQLVGYISENGACEL
jgi:hypothetical protein